jgi:serine protease inhibitor
MKIFKKAALLAVCGLVAMTLAAPAFAQTPALQPLLETAAGREFVKEILKVAPTATVPEVVAAIQKLPGSEITAIRSALSSFVKNAKPLTGTAKEIRAAKKDNEELAERLFAKFGQSSQVAKRAEKYADRSSADKVANASAAKKSVKLDTEGAQKINAFTQKLIAEILKKDAGKNVFITGPAMVSAVAMLVNGATDHAKAQLLHALGYGERELEKLNSNASALLKQMNASSGGVTTSMSNAFFVDEKLPVHAAYKNLVAKEFGAQAQNVQFEKNPKVASETINDWASKSTHGMINQILTADTASELAGLLASAIYFKGNWETQFNPQATRQSGFQLESGERVGVEMMNGTMDIEAIAERGKPYLVARLPYAGNGAAMYIVFPSIDYKTGKPAVSADEALLSAMQNGELSAFKNGDARVRKYEKEEVSLPKFKLKYSNGELKKIFQAMGVSDVFQGGALTALSPDGRLYVSYIKMDTALEVNEEGSRAAGVASIGMGLESMRVNQFEFNRPFAIVIRDEATGVDLFSGVIRDPRP